MTPDAVGLRPGEDAKFITLIIKPFRLEVVFKALGPFRVHSLTVSEVRGYGRQKGHVELYRGAEYVISFIPKLKLDFMVPSTEVEELVSAVRQAAKTGRIGDGKILIQPGRAVIE